MGYTDYGESVSMRVRCKDGVVFSSESELGRACGCAGWREKLDATQGGKLRDKNQLRGGARRHAHAAAIKGRGGARGDGESVEGQSLRDLGDRE